VAGVPLTPPGGSTRQEWVNPAAFSVPAHGAFGNLGRNAFRAPGISQLDLALAKNILLAERVKLRIRADVFNVFNARNMALPMLIFRKSISARLPRRSATTRRGEARRGSFNSRRRSF
jgi:hypothetical protein